LNWAIGINGYLENGPSIQNAQNIAAHELTKTTKVQDGHRRPAHAAEIEPIAV
jgi:hypothetical protein